MRCDICGKTFETGNRPDGLPNGMTFVLKDGAELTMCADCIIEMGKVREAESEGEK